MRIEIDDAQLYGRDCIVEAYVSKGHATVTVRMDGREFTDIYTLTPSQDREFTQAMISLVINANARPVLDHINAIAENGGRVHGARIVLDA